jgi:hypothetical protein
MKLSFLKTQIQNRERRVLLISLCLIGMALTFSNLTAQRWNTYTNTNNVTDVVMTTDKIYSATWGGVVEYKINADPATEGGLTSYVRTITSVDGLASNDVRTLAYEASTGDLWAGTSNNGITIVKSSGLQTLDTDSGLPSNKVRRIIVHESYIYVATDLGISQFYYLPGVYFPLLLHQYNATNTQGGLINNDIRDITVAENGYLYCATASGVSFVHTDSLDLDAAWHNWKNTNSPLLNSPVLSISASSNYVAMNTMTSIHRHGADPFASDWHTWTRASGNVQDSVFTVKISNNGFMFLSYGVWNEDTMSLTRKSSSVLAVIEGTNNVDHGIIPPYDEPLPISCIYRFIKYPDRYLVYATWGQGTYWNNDEEYHHIEDNCIGFQTISEIETDADNNIWIGSGWLGAELTRKGARGVSRWSEGDWFTYTINNSPLPSDNIKNVAIDRQNRKWFGSWYSAYEPYHWLPGAYLFDDSNNDWQWYTMTGIRQYSEDSGWGEAQSGTPTVINNTIADICIDKSGNILISSSGGGITALDQDYNLLGTFQMPSSSSVYQSVSYIYHSGSRYFFGLNADNRLVIWNKSTLPIGDNSSWVIPTPSELSNCSIYGMVSLTNVFDEEENWIAASSGLFMWDGTNWYKYDTDIKRRRYSNGSWVNDTLYYYDEERLFGSVRTTPTAIFLDPFSRIWIGSLENGFTQYDPDTERFTNYYQGNSPLLSNYITCFGYDPITGNLLIGTPDGLNTLEIGILHKTEKSLNSVKAFPNPFFPSRDIKVRIVNLPSQSMPKGTNVCKIYDSSGALVIELKENLYARFDWKGLNAKGKKCSSGIYFFVVSTASGETKRGKIALIRED